jgi:hypothetical protein
MNLNADQHTKILHAKALASINLGISIILQEGWLSR